MGVRPIALEPGPCEAVPEGGLWEVAPAGAVRCRPERRLCEAAPDGENRAVPVLGRPASDSDVGWRHGRRVNEGWPAGQAVMDAV